MSCIVNKTLSHYHVLTLSMQLGQITKIFCSWSDCRLFTYHFFSDWRSDCIFLGDIRK